MSSIRSHFSVHLSLLTRPAIKRLLFTTERSVLHHGCYIHALSVVIGVVQFHFEDLKLSNTF